MCSGSCSIVTKQYLSCTGLTPLTKAITGFRTAILNVQGQEKMSKSDPNSAIFMEDSAAEVKTKIKKAFCPPEQVFVFPCCASQAAELWIVG